MFRLYKCFASCRAVLRDINNYLSTMTVSKPSTKNCTKEFRTASIGVGQSISKDERPRASIFTTRSLRLALCCLLEVFVPVQCSTTGMTLHCIDSIFERKSHWHFERRMNAPGRVPSRVQARIPTCGARGTWLAVQLCHMFFLDWVDMQAARAEAMSSLRT